MIGIQKIRLKIKKLTETEKNKYRRRIKIELNKICEINFTYLLISEKINFYKIYFLRNIYLEI